MRRRRAVRVVRSDQPLMRWDVLNAILETTQQKRFLEIGCQFGNCGAKVRASEKWGVDPHPLGVAEHRYRKFFTGPSDHFFAKLPRAQLFDAILVDGLHHAEQVYTDVENALAHLSDDGVVVMHDCNPLTESAQKVPRQTGVWNGDCWKAMVRLRQRDDLDSFTINSDHGIGIVRKRRNPSPLRDVPADLTYASLAADRERMVGLVAPARWSDRAWPETALGKVAVVSAIFGDRDSHLDAPAATDADEFLMFTDAAVDPRGWKTSRVEPSADPRMAARRIKTLALEHTDADVVVWVDGRIRVTGASLRAMLRRALGSTDIAGFPHPWRKTAAAEAKECADLGLAPRAALERQIATYQADGFPDASGLWNTMVVARRNTPAMREFGRAWWAEVQRHTARDQVSFPYLLWKHGIMCGKLGDDVYRDGSSAQFHRGHHRSST